MKNIITYLRYINDFLKFKQYKFIIYSIRYMLFNLPLHKTCYYKSSLGLFQTRKGTIDFQFLNYAYEWSVKSFILNRYKDYNIFIDIGSNIGTYCFLMAQKGLKCYAFEPSKENFKAITTNIKLNHYENQIIPFNIGLGQVSETLDFIFDPMNTGASHNAKYDGKGIHEIVEINLFDDIFDQLKITPTDKVLIKIDVEGMEVDVIKGAKYFLSNHPNILIVMESILTGEDNIKNIFKEIGNFEFFEIDNSNIACKKSF